MDRLIESCTSGGTEDVVRSNRMALEGAWGFKSLLVHHSNKYVLTIIGENGEAYTLHEGTS